MEGGEFYPKSTMERGDTYSGSTLETGVYSNSNWGNGDEPLNSSWENGAVYSPWENGGEPGNLSSYPESNLTLDQFLAEVLGPKQLDGPLLLPVTVFYVIIFLTGLVGNISVCIVVGRNLSLHTAMNYYLLCLAISDLFIIILGVPHELTIYWNQYPFPFGQAFCKLRSFASEMFSYVNVLTILSFSLERYQAICHPLSSLPFTERSRVLLVFISCLLISAVFSLPHLLFTKLNYLEYPWGSGNQVVESAFCAMLDVNIEPQWYPVHELSFLVFFLVPVILLSVSYIRIGIMINRSAKLNLRRSRHRQSRGSPLDNRKQIIRMLVAVVIVFFVSWAPFHVQRLGYVYFKESESFRTVNEYLFYLSGCLYFLSCTLNPILYHIMNVKYRKAFVKTFCTQGPDPGSIQVPTWISAQTSTTIIPNSRDVGSVRLKLIIRRNWQAETTLALDSDRISEHAL
ncbi:neuropeptides capa receptor [Eurytemora carolleeae]|uniref:neuropeptides capa receptor n=1 Tax=Eurytemora carolleeae TaxID=1294199 RepID=UPI000C76AC0A|nr:neuropeptides capa receptor [Eurytemora carolleeae]|eukprot:XP_023320679.1 neuropeptides capa receptor-like [Eurytemora affinis]